eukprot:2161196-Pleurochrysis_carterae.AAC.1
MVASALAGAGAKHPRPAAASQLGKECSSNIAGDGPHVARSISWPDYAAGAAGGTGPHGGAGLPGVAGCALRHARAAGGAAALWHGAALMADSQNP